MNKFLVSSLFIFTSFLNAKIELLDRIAIIVDDGVVMESQIINSFQDVERGYQSQNIQMPPKDILMDQVKEKLIIEELQLQLADRAGVKISDAELNVTLTRLASNNQLTLEEFISYIEDNRYSYEEVDKEMKNEMLILRIRRVRVN